MKLRLYFTTVLLSLVYAAIAQTSVVADTLTGKKSKPELQLKEISVTGEKPVVVTNPDGTIALGKEAFNSLPALFGEADPIHAVEMQSGVQSGNEGARGIFIRGGSSDQTLLLLDQAPVYNASHIYGFTSVFNADAIDKVDVYKDNYPARYGGRLCSVMDINTAAGDTSKLKGSFSFSPIISHLHLEGPLGKKKRTTFSLSLRGCYVGLFSGPVSAWQFGKGGSTGNIIYYFGDVNVKLVHFFSPKTKIACSFFTSQDYYGFKQQQNDQEVDFQSQSIVHQSSYWANYAASVIVTHDINGHWQMKQTLTFSRYNIKSRDEENYSQTFYQNNGFTSQSQLNAVNKSYINDYAWRGDVTYSTSKQTFSGGTGITGYSFLNGQTHATVQSDNGTLLFILTGTQINSLNAFAYVSDEYRPWKRLVINTGVNANLYSVQQKSFVYVLPRFSISYNPVAKFYIRGSASGLSQNLHLLTTESANLLNDQWVPATAFAKPEQGWNFSGGMAHKLPLNFEWSIDAFYRLMHNVIEYANGSDQTSIYKPWENQVVTGGLGRSYGTEFCLARNAGKITGSIAYTLAWSERKFAALNDGLFYPYKYDRRHNLAVQAAYHINGHFELGASFVYGSGNTISVPLLAYHSFGSVNAYYQFLAAGDPNPTHGDLFLVYDGRNNARLPAYHHLDLSFTYRKTVKHLEHIFNLNIYNVYNNFNVFTIYASYKTNSDGSQDLIFNKVSLFPIVPSVSYTIKF